jgi:dTDP-4-dehydrorhamnose 3,5-epimerase-like enzyme
MNIPKELSVIFNMEHFEYYPFIEIPQKFADDRGLIQNLVDGMIGDVAIIDSNINSIRANHIHKLDWHFSYLTHGSMTYSWKELDSVLQTKSILVSEGQMIFTPPKTPHKMEFLEKSQFIAISALSRSQDNYEADTERLSFDYFGSH